MVSKVLPSKVSMHELFISNSFITVKRVLSVAARNML